MKKKKKKKHKAVRTPTAPPEAFLERLQSILPEGDYQRVVESFAVKKPVIFRLHRPCSAEEVLRDLQENGLAARPVPWRSGAYLLAQGTLRDLQERPAWTSGRIYVQDLSSQWVADQLGARSGERILDMAAAPGSKTTQIALKMNGDGEIYAGDSVRSRYYKLKANLAAQGYENARAFWRRGESWGKSHPEYFDRVLLDAPCSSEGRFSLFKPKSFAYWRPAKVKEMARKQKRLLFSAFQALKPGGVLVYATCTFAPEENEAVLEQGLRRFGDSAEVEALKPPFSNWMPALSRWQGRSFDPRVRQACRILPDPVMSPFFAARIRKKCHFSEEASGDEKA